MSDSNTDATSSEDDFAILSFIKGGDESPVRQKSKMRKVVRAVQRKPQRDNTRKTGESFKLELPAVFQTDGERNERLLKNDEKIKSVIGEYETKLKSEYSSIQTKKQRIVDELNDNGSVFENIATKDSEVESRIDGLVKVALDRGDTALNRKFFFYSSPYVNREHMIKSSLPFQIDNFFFLHEEKQLSRMIGSFPVEFLEHSISRVSNLDYLRLIKGLMKFYATFDYTISTDRFLEYLEVIGGNSKATSDGVVRFKLCQINENVSLTVLRSFILFKYALSASNSNEIMGAIQRAFFLAIADYNLNAQSSDDFRAFVEEVFVDIVSTGNKSLRVRESLSAENISILFQSLAGKILHGTDSMPQSFMDALVYNILRTLNCFSTDSYCKRVVQYLNASFLMGHPYKPVPDDRLPLESPHIISVVETFYQCSTGEIQRDLSSAHPITPESYLCMFHRIQVLPYIFYRSFDSDGLKASQSSLLEHLRLVSLPRLKELAVRLTNLKSRVYSLLSSVGSVSIPHNNLYYKSLIVRVLSESYFIFDKLERRTSDDISLFEVNESAMLQ